MGAIFVKRASRMREALQVRCSCGRLILIDFTNHMRRGGMTRNEAPIKAGSTRLRPIVMTTLAIIF